MRIHTHTRTQTHRSHKYNSTTQSCALACARACMRVCVCVSCTHSKAEISCLQFNLATVACDERERKRTHTQHIRCFVCPWNGLRPPTLRDCGLRVCVCNFRVTTTTTNTARTRCHACVDDAKEEQTACTARTSNRDIHYSRIAGVFVCMCVCVLLSMCVLVRFIMRNCCMRTHTHAHAPSNSN